MQSTEKAELMEIKNRKAVTVSHRVNFSIVIVLKLACNSQYPENKFVTLLSV